MLLAATSASLAAAADALVVVGGDGMVHLGAQFVAGTGIPLGIVPTGTGNDMARGLGIPIGDPDAAISMIFAAARRAPRVIDAARVTLADGSTSWFACVLSAGFDAIVNERANRMRRPRSPARYTIALLRELVALRPIRYTIELGGIRSERDAIFVAVGNNSSFGRGMRVVPDAVLDDGMLDVVSLDPVNRRQLLRIFPRVTFFIAALRPCWAVTACWARHDWSPLSHA